MPFSTLISTETVAAHLADPTFALVDCRFKLEDVIWGERDYASRHIPGAVYAHLDRDLSGPKTGHNGRHPLPDMDTLIRTLSRFGIEPGIQVVAYDQDAGAFASRLWWLLRWLGHDAVAVLDGGLAKWVAESRAVVGGLETRSTRSFVGHARASLTVAAEQVQEAIGAREWLLLDARAPERYRGEIEPVDKVAGRIPTSRNFFHQRTVRDDGTFRSIEELRQGLGAAIEGMPPDRVICYCGSGVTACQNLLAMEHVGLHGAKLYPGSWSEWSSDAARPVARG